MKGSQVWSPKILVQIHPFKRYFLPYILTFWFGKGKKVDGGADVLSLSKFSKRVTSNYRSKIPYPQF